MKTKKDRALQLAEAFQIIVLVKQAGNAKTYDKEYLLFPDGTEEEYRTGACSFFRESSSENVDKVIKKDKQKLKKRLKTLNYIKYKGSKMNNYFH